MSNQVTNNALAKVSHKHEDMMRFLIANPALKLGDVAAHYGVTQAWLSTILHSDAFQAKFRDMQDEYTGGLFLSIHDKLNGLAQVALDKIGEELELTTGMDAPLKVGLSVLDRLGYGTKSTNINVKASGAPGTITSVTVESTVLHEALAKRDEFLRLREIEGETIDETKTPERVHSSGGADRGVLDHEARLSQEEALLWQDQSGNSLRGSVPPVGAEKVGGAVSPEPLVEVLGEGWREAPVVPE